MSFFGKYRAGLRDCEHELGPNKSPCPRSLQVGKAPAFCDPFLQPLAVGWVENRTRPFSPLHLTPFSRHTEHGIASSIERIEIDVMDQIPSFVHH